MPKIVSIDDSNLKRRLARIQKKIDSGTKLSVQDTGRWARDQIKGLMPKASGDSARSIIYKIEKMTPNIKEVVITQIPGQPHPEKHFKNGKWFNLPMWMFDSPRAINHPWRGGASRVMTMRTVPGFAFVRFGQSVRIELAKALK